MPLGAFKAALMGTAGVSTGDVVLLSSQTASDSASLDFTSGITSTYGEYIFKFYNINSATDNVQLHFQCSTDGGSNYDETVTSSFFSAWHNEGDDQTGFAYQTSFDLAEETSYQRIAANQDSASDQSSAGELHLFNPASTTYVKHFYSHLTEYANSDYNNNDFAAGYFNTTSAVNAIQFKMSSGNFDGTIKMWGVK